MDIQRAFRFMPALILVIRPDADFTIAAASDAYLKATHTDAGIVGRPVFEVFPDNPHDPDATGVATLTASFRAVISTLQPHTTEPQRYDIRQPGSSHFEERYWTSVNSPLLDAQGRLEYIVQTTEPATAKGRRDAIAILESITEGFFTLDRQWRFDYVNSEAHRILGREPGELSGQVVWQAYPGLEGTDFERNYQRTMQDREKTSFTAFYAAQERWYEVTTFPAPEGVSVFFRNVTGQKSLQAERETLMAESERQRRIYETALNSTPDFVYVFDLDHRALYANDALLKTWGVADVRGKTWVELGYEQWHADMHDSELDQVIRTRAPIRGEIPFTGTGGRRIYDYIFAPVLDADGEVVAVAGTTRDITDRQASEQALLEQAERLAGSDRAKDEFLATLSHELRNPLAPLRNAIALLRRTGGANDAAGKIHAVMERQVNHMVRLVDDLLEVSRISRGALSLRMERLELANVIRNALETSHPLIQAAGHKLELLLPLQPLWVDGDAVRLAQVLSNLLNNAANYTEAGGRITIEARREGQQAQVVVTDTGIGMNPDTIAHMFEMFSRGNRDSAHHQGGLGIGLALSRRLAQMHGGTLEARSQGLGHGSTFTVMLPLAGGVADAQAGSDATATRLDELRVLVVDDNADAGDTLAELLDMLGAQVRVARDGASGLQAFADWQPAVVLLDIGMPGMNGYEVARAIRVSQRTLAGPPVVLVALTGWGQDDDRRRAEEAGFDHHMVKPADIDLLEKLLASIGPMTPAA
ncbi:MAG: PAS domain-containing protein [Polaromonas sp.]|nr:PAS domain-containing protein [Polaromonas sp.]